MARATPLVHAVAIAAWAMAAACARAPELEEKGDATIQAGDPAVAIESAAVVSGKVVVTYSLTDRGTPITGANASALNPAWTLAWLDVEPVSGLPAWRSMIPTGRQTIGCLPPGGPGTPGTCVPDTSPTAQPGDMVTSGQFVGNSAAAPLKQPGSESSVASGAFVRTEELGGGRFRYTFLEALPSGFNLGATLRVGVVLYGVANGTANTCATWDFVPNGGAIQSYETTRDVNCNACHGLFKIHGNRYTGVKLCLTCHTWQHADPDTVDPAAMDLGKRDTALPPTDPPVKSTYPNPLELGRLVHRIHRGKNLPTLYLSPTCYAGTTAPAGTAVCNVTALPPVFPPDGPPASPPALPFRPGRYGAAPIGSRYSVIGYSSIEYFFGRVATRTENQRPAVTAVEGVGYPQDLRNCEACHLGAPQASATVTSISRRTCSGCHPEVWYGAVSGPAELDPVHMAHSGGPQADDGACRDCHVEPRAGGPTRWVPIAEAHLAPVKNPRSKLPRFEIVEVQSLLPGTPGSPGTPGPATATIKFKVSDPVGPLTSLGSPSPAMDPDTSSPSPVPRKLTSLGFRIGGPNSDFLTGGGHETAFTSTTPATYTRTFSYSITSSTSATAVAPPWQVACTTPLLTLTADASGVFTCTFPNPLADLNLVPGKVEAAGYWTIGVEGRRGSSAAALVPPVLSTSPWYGWALGYDPVSDRFRWPFTGEAVTEAGENVFVSVDLATGRIASQPSAARRTVVAKERCNACHLRLAFHGQRTEPKACLFCHAPDATDWMYRPRDLRPAVGTGMVLLWDPLEYPPDTTKAWTYATADGIEERSISLKVMIHRIHTGESEGVASLEGIRPFVIHAGATRPAFLDDVRFPNALANCETCHVPGTWAAEAVPLDAAPTSANERGSILHVGTAASPARPTHASASEKVLPVTAACLGCHTSGAAADHAAGKTSGGVELCPSCHGASGGESVRKWHAVP